MQKRNNSQSNPLRNQQYFMLEDIRGKWESCSGDRSRMPKLHIYLSGKFHHRVEFSYNPQTVFNCPLWHRWGIASFYLYGRIRLSYDAERDILHLSEYGDYTRVED